MKIKRQKAGENLGGLLTSFFLKNPLVGAFQNEY
jgi:hypothetical protein